MNTDTTKRYRLLKELPDSKVGDIYIWNDTYKRYYKGGNVMDSYWMEESVENNPEWFEEVLPVSEPVNGRVTVHDFHRESSSTNQAWFSFLVKGHVTSDKYNAIKYAIEKVLNNDTVVEDRRHLPKDIDVQLYKLTRDNKALKSVNEQFRNHIEALNKKHQSEVDTIRKETWMAARQWLNGRVEPNLFPAYPTECKYVSLDTYLSSLNLNTNDTGKEFIAPASLAQHPQCKPTKPPLGLIPQHIWEERRIWDIAAAVERYQKAGKEIPKEWLAEDKILRKEKSKQSPPLSEIKEQVYRPLILKSLNP